MTDQHRIDEVAHALLSLYRHETGHDAGLDAARAAIVAALASMAVPVPEPSPMVVTAVEVRPNRITDSVLESAGFGQIEAPKEDA